MMLFTPEMATIMTGTGFEWNSPGAGALEDSGAAAEVAVETEAGAPGGHQHADPSTEF